MKRNSNKVSKLQLTVAGLGTFSILTVISILWSFFAEPNSELGKFAYGFSTHVKDLFGPLFSVTTFSLLAILCASYLFKLPKSKILLSLALSITAQIFFSIQSVGDSTLQTFGGTFGNYMANTLYNPRYADTKVWAYLWTFLLFVSFIGVLVPFKKLTFFKREKKSTQIITPEVLPPVKNYKIPRVDEVFSESPKSNYINEDEENTGRKIESCLNTFKIDSKVINSFTGPLVTSYEIELEPGVKLSKVSMLADELSMALGSESVNIVAPIPGTSFVGIEVPNKHASIVYIRDVLSRYSTSDLNVALGKNTYGEPYTLNIATTPHLLIAGQTGSGKSMCINSIVSSLLLNHGPDTLRMIMIDPKVVELSVYKNIPHLLLPIITSPSDTLNALHYTIEEMERRYQLLESTGVRDIKSFNESYERLPYIVVIIDELSDLMLSLGKKLESSIVKLSQKARSVGIHLIIATQRPSVKVITGTIKANLPTRIAFKVSSQIDSRIILDVKGAENLLGRGDMLLKAIDSQNPIRLHGSYISDAECNKLAKLCK